jgi:hypothetical protein
LMARAGFVMLHPGALSICNPCHFWATSFSIGFHVCMDPSGAQLQPKSLVLCCMHGGHDHGMMTSWPLAQPLGEAWQDLCTWHWRAGTPSYL